MNKVQSPCNPCPIKGAMWGANPSAMCGNPRCNIYPLIPLEIAPAHRRGVHPSSFWEKRPGKKTVKIAGIPAFGKPQLAN